MADTPDLVRVLSLEGPVLSASAVAGLAAQIARLTADDVAPDDARPVLIDCSALTELTASGLAALRELGLAAAPPLALAGLSRGLTLAALQAELSAAFSIYLSVEAYTRSRARGEPACAR